VIRAALLAFLVPGCAETLEVRAARIHREAIVVDSHVDSLQRVLFDDVDLGVRQKEGHGDLVRFREGGLDAPFLALWVDPIFTGPAAVKRTLQLADAFRRVCEAHPDRIGQARSAREVEALVRAGKIAAVMSIEGGHAIDDDLGVLREFHRIGVRAMTLTHTNTNDWCDSSGDVEKHGGLTDFGRKVVAEMNRIGMLVDVSHVSDKAFDAALAASTKPVIATHSCCRALSNHRRNLTDDQLRALGKNGGVVAITFVASFVDEKYRTAAEPKYDPGSEEKDLKTKFGSDLEGLARASYARFRAERPKTARPSLASLLDQIEHAAKVAGHDHVGLGSDFDGMTATPDGIDCAACLPKITEGLLRRGWSEEDVKKLLGGNTLRVMRVAIGE
jgi:membrane dipeptidase